MSTETQEMPTGTKPVEQHKWLEQLVGEWTTRSEMWMGPDQEPMTASGVEKVTLFGGLWAFAEGTANMPDGSLMEYKNALGYDVTFHQYRGCWFANMSSHLWKQEGTMSADGKTLTLDCVGPDMVKDNATANYRDVIEIVDANSRTMTSYGQDEEGNWTPFMKVTFTRTH